MSRDSSAPFAPVGGLKLPPWLVIVIVLGFLGVAWYQNRQQDEVARQVNAPAQPQQSGTHDGDSREIGSEPISGAARDPIPASGGRDEPVLAEIMPERGPATRREVQRDTTTPSPEKPTTDRSPTSTRAGPAASTTDRSAPTKPTSPVSPTQPANDPRRPDSGKQSPTPTKIDNQTIKDFGRIVFTGTIDLHPTLDRIARGEKNSHRNDGSIFGNRERRLPQKPNGYYTEYVHPTKGISGPGPQRVIVGKNGDIWYTPDHYETFKKIK